MNKLRRWLLALGLPLLLSGWLLLTLPITHAQSEVPFPDGATSLPRSAWQQAVALIEQDRVAGILSTDEAALLRFTALTDWQQLLLGWQPLSARVC